MRPALPLLAIVALAATTHAAEWQYRASAGGQLDASSHGTVDLGLRKGPFSIQLLTDTLDVRWAPETGRGRWWVGLRGEAAAAGLMISPWTDGAPDPARALLASYAGADGGWVRYLPWSLYAGVQGSARVYFFNALDSTRIAVPSTTPVGTVDVAVGRYTEAMHVWLRAGLDVTHERVAPHAAVEAIVRPPGEFAPRLELRAGWAWNQDFLLRTRLGGLNPYVVPLAGAGWAEWWVETYVAARLAFDWSGRALGASLLVDAAAWDGELRTGFGLAARWRWRRLSVEGTVGYAPWIPRQEGVGRVSLWLLAAIDWGGFRRW